MHYIWKMKTASIPSIRVEPALRSTLESVLGEGETLTQFVEHAIRQTVFQRQQQNIFIERGLASLALAEKNQDHVTAHQVLSDLKVRLKRARAPLKRSGG